MLATRAAVRLACDFKFEHIVMPGMGTGCGRLLHDVAARAMTAGIEAGLCDMPYRPYSWQEARHFQLKGWGFQEHGALLIATHVLRVLVILNYKGNCSLRRLKYAVMKHVRL